jgi:sterol desaturase/sphingolipid hydroxylase (fatty acid hydroxylase superfamily)
MIANAFLNLALIAAIFLPLEAAFRARPHGIFRPAFALDLTFFLGQHLVWTGLATSLLSAGAVAIGRPALLSNAPAVAQIVVAVVLGDLLVYGFHRACHRSPLLWRFHAVHHRAEALDWLAAHREHPVDGLLTQIAVNLPAIVLGVRLELLAGIAIFRGIWAIFVHSNVEIPLGPLAWIFGAPELHRFHHARVARTEHNFANLAPWIDLLFGTHHRPPKGAQYPLGVPGERAEGYGRELLRPFVPRARIASSSNETSASA